MNRRWIRFVLPVLAVLAVAVIYLITQADGQSPRRARASAASASRVTRPGAVSSPSASRRPSGAPSVSTRPPDPLPYRAGQEFFLADGLGQYDGAANAAPRGSGTGYYTSGYWVEVPASYRVGTPETLLVWDHGCDGNAKFDDNALASFSSGPHNYIVMALSGPEAGNAKGPDCWETSTAHDVDKVMTDLRQIERHFNINRRRVYIGGYSSGGDLAYQTIFTHARTFVGILAVNTNPVSGTIFQLRWGLGAIGHAISGAGWKFHVVQLSHADDDLYHVNRCGYSGYPTCPTGDPSGASTPDPGVRPAINALRAAGFPVIWTIVPGHHYDPDTPARCDQHWRSTCRGGTYDVLHWLLPSLEANWMSPAR